MSRYSVHPRNSKSNMKGGYTMENFKAVKHEKQLVNRFTTDPNLLGIGVGPKEVEGNTTPNHSIEILCPG
jgi:hypothetical protein